MNGVRPVPKGFHTVTPHLVIRNAQEAIDFYRKAFQAEVASYLLTPDGEFVLHAELKIGDSIVMLCDEFPGMERWVAPHSLSGTTVALHIWTDDVDRDFARAVKAGARVRMPVTEMFWGDRYGRLTDPFGHEWTVATRLRELTPDEIRKAADEYFRTMES